MYISVNRCGMTETGTLVNEQVCIIRISTASLIPHLL